MRVETHQAIGYPPHLGHLERNISKAGAHCFILEAIGIAHPIFAALIGAGLEKVRSLDLHRFIHQDA